MGKPQGQFAHLPRDGGRVRGGGRGTAWGGGSPRALSLQDGAPSRPSEGAEAGLSQKSELWPLFTSRPGGGAAQAALPALNVE